MTDRLILPLRSKIAAGLVTAVLVLVVGAIAWWAVQRATKSSEDVSHTSQVLLEQRKLLGGLADAETAARGYALTGDSSFLAPFEDARLGVPASIARLRLLTTDHPEQATRLDTLESVANEQISLNQQIIRIRNSDGFELASALIRTGQGRQVMDHARALTDLMEAEENRMLQARAAKQKRDQRLASLVIIVGASLAFILSLLINRSIRTDVLEREHQREMIERQTRQLRKQATTLEQALAKARKAEAEQSRLARQMTALLESTEAGFYGMDADGICTFINRAGARMLGFEVEELIGKEMHAQVHHHHADGSPYPLAECPIYNACRKGTVTAADNEVFWRKDGTPLSVEYSTSPMVEGSDLKGGVVAFADVTERLRAQRALAESEARKAAVLRSTLDSIIAMDANGLVTEFNPAAEVAFGYSRAEVIGKRLADLIVPDRFREAHIAGLKRYVETGEEHVIGKRLELPARRKDGSEFQSELTITRSDASGIPAFTGVLRDITERKRAEAEREQLIKALARSNQELDQFAYVASHDLKAPLRGIANLSQWIEEDLGDTLAGENKEQMELLRGRVHRMEALIDGILQYSRAGRVKAKPEDIYTGVLVREVVELMAPPGETRINIPGDMPVVRSEKVPLQQVFMNLLGNAIKHAASDSPRIDVAWSDAGAFFEFTVQDNGQGIAPQYHERIFGIFQTLEARDKVEGTGIGLSVVQKIVEAKGGRVWVESDTGKGARFKFLWPKTEVWGA
jgi:two-component system sensor kinase FixL